MKNKFKNILFMLIIALFAPITMFLSACGATPSGTVTGVLFDSMAYDEDGTPVFYVDKDVTTSLKYKVYPSSASGYKVYFDPVGTGTPENSSRYLFENGKITVNYDTFEDVRYKVRIGDYSDTCIVKLREYPKEIYTTKTEVVLNSGDVQDIVIKGNFLNAQNISRNNVNISDSQYSFIVETEDETIVNIPNENRLKFIAIRQNGTASTTVTATMLDGNGEKTDLKVQIKVTVVQNISKCKVIMSGAEEFVENNDTVELKYGDLNTYSEDAQYKIINLEIYPINTNKQLSMQENYTMSLNKDTDYVVIADDDKSLLVKSSITDKLNNYASFEIKLKIYFPDLNIKDEQGKTSSFTLTINISIVN